MRPTSACTVARCSVPRGFDSTAAARSASFIFLLPSKATRSSTGASVRCTTSRSPAPLDRNLVEQACCDQRFQRRIAWRRRIVRLVQHENTSGRSRRRRGDCLRRRWSPRDDGSVSAARAIANDINASGGDQHPADRQRPKQSPVCAMRLVVTSRLVSRLIGRGSNCQRRAKECLHVR